MKREKKTMSIAQPIWWFIFHDDQILLEKKNGTHSIPCCPETFIPLPEGETIHDISILEGYPCKAFTTSAPIDENERYIMTDLRSSYDSIPYDQFVMAGKAREILYWDRTTKFCPVCGTHTEQIMDIAKKCPACGHEMFPYISAAILALVRKNDSVLLVQAHNFRSPFHSLVAGFLETGETLEECVKREVLEETGLTVKNITYFGNQAWPFPSGLMVGFIADYESGEIQLQDDELRSGAFYTKDNMPELPRKLSLARKMIDWWLENC